ncbi:MAG: IS200/IS605 family transposase [Dissulfurispiraceae bacterium]
MVPERRKTIFKDAELRQRAEQLFREICDEYEFEIEEMEVGEDHVHILISFHPKYSIGQVVRTLKSISARELFREFPRIKKRLWSGQLWEDGYFARTVGDRMTRQIVEKYIRHHRKEEQGPAQLF